MILFVLGGRKREERVYGAWIFMNKRRDGFVFLELQKKDVISRSRIVLILP